jgi:hypothetical protein
MGKARVKHISDTYVLVNGVPGLKFEFSVAHGAKRTGPYGVGAVDHARIEKARHEAGELPGVIDAVAGGHVM